MPIPPVGNRRLAEPALAGGGRSSGRAAPAQHGASLIVVMIIIVIVSILGISGSQIAMMGEHTARNDRNYQVAFQSAETALHDATNDIEGAGTATRGAVFAPGNRMDFAEGCGTTGITKGLCAPKAAGKPVWLEVDLDGPSSPAARFGEFTGAPFEADETDLRQGVKPARKPRYIVEVIDDKYTVGTDLSLPGGNKVLYRTTAMGFGPRVEAQAVVQMLYAKE